MIGCISKILHSPQNAFLYKRTRLTYPCIKINRSFSIRGSIPLCSEEQKVPGNLPSQEIKDDGESPNIVGVRKYHPPIQTGKRGMSVLHDPLYNKGTSFRFSERDRLGLRGLVPPRRLPMKVQLQKLYQGYKEEEDPLKKNIFLTDLQNRNETLFYRLVIEHIEEMAPIIYTPTVGLVCQKFGSTFRRSRGMYFSSADKGQFGAMLHNWPCDDVEIIVVTDGSRILGLGDLGANGMGIPMGKLALYTAGGGVDPRKVLPVMLDTGTNNRALLNDPFYLGMQHPRLEDAHFWSIIDEFMRAVRHRWPHCLVQFEDFSSDHAADVLSAYRLEQLCFNDDIQGTGAVVLAGALTACKVSGIPLRDQRIVVLGAGSAGLGVATTLLQGILQEGVDTNQAQKRFWVFDHVGLLGRTRKGMNSGQFFFSRDDMEDATSLVDVIKQIKPTMILGLSAAKGAFHEEAIREMAKHVDRPIVFPLSNPTSVAECTAQEAYEWTNGKCVFASGSPFDPVTYNGCTYQASQCNNMFIFPGVGLASIISKATRVTDRMLYAAATALANCVTEDEMKSGQIFPQVKNIRHVSQKVATAVVQVSLDDYIARERPNIRRGASLENYVGSRMYSPSYHPLV